MARTAPCVIEDHPEDASASGREHPDRVLRGISACATMAKHEDHAFHLSRQNPDIAHPDVHERVVVDVAHAEHRRGVDHDVRKSVAERRQEAGESL